MGGFGGSAGILIFSCGGARSWRPSGNSESHNNPAMVIKTGVGDDWEAAPRHEVRHVCGTNSGVRTSAVENNELGYFVRSTTYVFRTNAEFVRNTYEVRRRTSDVRHTSYAFRALPSGTPQPYAREIATLNGAKRTRAEASTLSEGTMLELARTNAATILDGFARASVSSELLAHAKALRSCVVCEPSP